MERIYRTNSRITKLYRSVHRKGVLSVMARTRREKKWSKKKMLIAVRVQRSAHGWI